MKMSKHEKAIREELSNVRNTIGALQSAARTATTKLSVAQGKEVMLLRLLGEEPEMPLWAGVENGVENGDEDD